MNTTAFIINPNSAHGKYQQFLPAIHRLFPESPIHISKSKHDTEEFIKSNWEKIEYFIAIGGDGTVSSIAALLIHSEKKLGIIPTGSGNGFAKETNFEQNVIALARKIQSGKSTCIDTFMINDHFGINVSGVGFDAFVAKEFEKTRRGLINYIKVSLRSYFQFKEIPVKGMREDGTVLFKGNFLFVEIANSRQFGNNAFIAPNASLQDGLLDIILVKKFPWWQSLQFGYQLFAGKILRNPSVEHFSLSVLEVQTSYTTWHIDGDYIEIQSPVKITIQRNSLRLISD